jgi:presenilin-like A22 family membrane protease
MFLLTQFIGIYVVNYYSPTKTVNSVQQNVTSPNELPFGLEPPPMNQQVNVWMILLYMLPAFVIAIGLFFLLTKLKAEIILKGWFFLVVIIALAITLMSFLPEWSYMWIIAVAVAATLAFFKIYKRNFIVHNLTELLIYPGIAAVFVSLLSSPENPNRGVFAAIALLILISFYDMWAVWRSKIMQKMAKYQIDTLKIFSGFFIPYASKSVREKMKKMKKDKKNKGKKVKVNIAILGGGDVVFPIITSGVVLRRFGFTEVLGIQLPLASLLIIAGAALGLGLLFAFSEKKKFYPAMPFISAGIFVAMGLCYLIF